MEIYHGKSVWNGIAIGRIRVLKREGEQIRQYQIKDTKAEKKRFNSARKTAVKQLEKLYERAVEEVGKTGAAVFLAHKMILEDEGFIGMAEDTIRKQKVNAEYAAQQAGNYYADMFRSMEDSYMQERAMDVMDVTGRVIEILTDRQKKKEVKSEEPMIILADDLAPSDTMQLDKDKVLSFVTVRGSLNSHTAILARTMSIPSLIGTDITLDESLNGKMAVVNAYSGLLYVEPDEETLRSMRSAYERDLDARDFLLAYKGQRSITQDGRQIMTYANISTNKDLPRVLKNDAEGIGLFRSEFLYLESETYPPEDAQFWIYKEAAETMAGKRVIIRTLDIGADKKADYFGLRREENPAMGMRAIRICLTRPKIFKTQLRAIYRASAYGDIAIMYPMITSLKEVHQVKEIAAEVRQELTMEHIPFSNVKQGIMIETPAAAVISDILAKEVDFFSIGTNDLTQYTLAVDRQSSEAGQFFDDHHPAVLRMIRQVVENAHAAGIWCGICGELAGDPELTKLFLAMGVDELSVSPGTILALRKIIIETNVEQERDQLLAKWLDI